MMIAEFGHFALILAFVNALLLAILPAMAIYKPEYSFLQRLTKPLVMSLCFFVTIAFVTLVTCFVQDDFSVAYVAENSYSGLPFIYKICAVWGAHEGSLLLWSFILSLWTLAFSFKAMPQKYQTVTLSILGAINFGFLLLLLHTSNPFQRLLPYSPTEGVDLNPLLQDPGFVLHPPILYMGYVGLALPFALSITGLIFTKENFAWTKLARPFALLAWAFLTLGITLGSWWAYYELGWGGWWFWDPVENASFMPWLLGAALIHALFMSFHENHFPIWCTFLAISAFLLSLLGTFLVRSGVVSSVHAFASDPLRGSFILGFFILVMVCSFSLFLYRFWQAPPASKVPLLSKESFIFLGNILFLVATLTILLGTLFPLITEVLWQEKMSVGPPYFNQVFMPLMLPLFILMAVAPYIAWRKDSFLLLKKKITSLLVMFFGCALLILGFLTRVLPWTSLIGVLLAAWIILATLYKLILALKKSWSLKFSGMFFAHFGLGLAILGMSLVTVLETETEVALKPASSVEVAGYTFVFQKLEDCQGSNYEGKKAEFLVKDKEKTRCVLKPEKRFFVPRNLPMTETAIKAELLQDFYIALGEPLADGSWTVRLYIKPFIRFIWLGGLCIALGALLSSIQAFRQESK